jgi:hypothetical protein
VKKKKKKKKKKEKRIFGSHDISLTSTMKTKSTTATFAHGLHTSVLQFTVLSNKNRKLTCCQKKKKKRKKKRKKTTGTRRKSYQFLLIRGNPACASTNAQ